MKIPYLLYSTFFILILITSEVSAQNTKTKLHITVIDDSGNNVTGATITIYSSQEDYENSTNKLITGKSDKKGIFQFKGLEAKSYFLDVRKDHLKNDGLGVQTGLLSENKVNKVLVVIK